MRVSSIIQGVLKQESKSSFEYFKYLPREVLVFKDMQRRRAVNNPLHKTKQRNGTFHIHVVSPIVAGNYSLHGTKVTLTVL